MLMLVKSNTNTHLRVLLVLRDRGILAHIATFKFIFTSMATLILNYRIAKVGYAHDYL